MNNAPVLQGGYWKGNPSVCFKSTGDLRRFFVEICKQVRLRGIFFSIFSFKGMMDCKLLIILLQQFPRINNRVVEPAPDQLVHYKALVQSKAQELHGVSCDWRQQTIDQYEKAGDLTKFHFISAVHSIYYVDDVEGSLMYLYNHLEPGGIMLVIIISGINFNLFDML